MTLENFKNVDSVEHHKKREELCLGELKLLIQENGDLQRFQEFFDKAFLLHFVRGKKYDANKAYSAIENYIYVRTTRYRDLFKGLTTKNMDWNCGMLNVLKHRDQQNRLVVLDRTCFWNPEKLPVKEAFKLVILFIEEIWNIEEAEKNGVVFVFDMQQFTLQQMKAMPPTEVYTALNMFFNNIPLQYAGIHVVNESYFVTLFLRIIKPALPKKLRQRLHIHSTNLESLHEHVSPDCLPESLGGNVPEEEFRDENFEERVRAKEEYYKKFAERL